MGQRLNRALTHRPLTQPGKLLLQTSEFGPDLPNGNRAITGFEAEFEFRAAVMRHEVDRDSKTEIVGRSAFG